MHGRSRAGLKTLLSRFLAFVCLASSISVLGAGLLRSASPALAFSSLIAYVGIAIVLFSSRFPWKRIVSEAEDVDKLTGFPTRGAFIRAGAKSIERAAAGTIGLVICEVKGLSALRRCCGGPIGDDVLRLAAHRLLMAANQNGTVFRIGGDKFAVIVDRGNGDRLAGIVLAVRTFEFELSGLEHSHKIRLPAGFASLEAGEGFNSLVKRAIKRLRDNESPIKAAAIRQHADNSWPEPKLSTGQLALPRARALRLVGAADD